jgi:hypothetical protein
LTESQRRARSFGAKVGAGIGAVITVLALGVALLSLLNAPAKGHGFFAYLLFPYPMGVANYADTISFISIGMSFFQFPIYGAIIGYASGSSRKAAALWALVTALLHGVTFALSWHYNMH